MNLPKIYRVDQSAFDPFSRHSTVPHTPSQQRVNTYVTLLKEPVTTLAGSVNNRADVKSAAILGYN